ncbi:MAG: acyl-ACP--UDP-N-acetylglucosamine O-acyltransferase [Pseudomonadota bacterium]
MIDERAIIHPSAKLGKNVTVGPWSIIGEDVEIDDDTWIGSHVFIKGPTKIGKGNKIYQFTSLGEDPQSKDYHGGATRLEIGDYNLIREFVTINRATESGGGVTKIGDHNFIMSYVHIAHDCQVGNHVIFANNSALSGHVFVDDYAVFGGYAGVHQYCRIGCYSFMAGTCGVSKDVPPFILVSGSPASPYGLNLIGLRRNQFPEATISQLRKAYNIIYRKGLSLQQAVNELEKMVAECKEIGYLVHALNNTSRGVVR